MTIFASNQGVNNKTKELVLYVAAQLMSDPKYGATILNKALYLIDCVSFLENEKAISDFSYIKQSKGPTPKPSQFLSVKTNLIDGGEAEEIITDYFGLAQKKLIPKRQANLVLFTGDEIALIDRITSSIKLNHNASSISDFTHNMLAWKAAKPMEELPLYTYLLTSCPPSQEDIEWGLKVKSDYLN